MAHLLDRYPSPYDPSEPMVTSDECSAQALDCVCQDLPMQADRFGRNGYEYEYARWANTILQALVEPLAG